MMNCLRTEDYGEYHLVNLYFYLYFPSTRLTTFENAHDFYDFPTFEIFGDAERGHHKKVGQKYLKKSLKI